MSEKRWVVLAAASIVAFFLIGLANLNKYGHGDDEQWLERRAQLATAAAFSIFKSAPRPEIPREQWVYHPSLYATINYGPWRGGHALNLFMAGLCLTGLFLLARQLAGAEAAAYAVLFLIFFPRFLAHAHYNPKEIPMMAGAVFSFVLIARWSAHAKISLAAASGLLLGMAASAHLGALVLLPIFPVLALSRHLWKHAAAFSAAVFVAIYAFWPALWIKPALLFEALVHFTGPFASADLGYFGQVYKRYDVPWHYALFYLTVATPAATLLFIGRGIRLFPKSALHAALIAWILLPLLVRLNPWAVKYNDIRHVFIAVPPLMIYAGWGLKTLFTRLGRNGALATGAALALYFFIQIRAIHPFEGDYFNEIFRAFMPARIERSFDFPSWMASYRQGIEWLNANARPDALVYVPHRISVARTYDVRADIRLTDAVPADYLMIAGLGWEYGPWCDQAEPLFEIRRYNSRVLGIYETR